MSHLLNPRKLGVDLVFFAWLLYAVVSGRLVPEQIVAIFQNEPPAVVVTEPANMPGDNQLINLEPQLPEA